ncbi:Protein PLASTID MOVEMENT IMPAIRED 2 [Glycine max]|nr:Protein PLASTID MOVEMENT IMPAIRED 2 [Glycine max]
MEAANCLSYESQFGCLYEEEYRDFGEVVAAASLRHVLVNGKVRIDKTYPAGFMGIGLNGKLGVNKFSAIHEANEFSFKLESTRRNLKEAIEEIDESKELEMKLVVTISDVDFLQNELKSVKEMDKRVQGDGSTKQLEGRFKKGEELEDSIVLQNITKESEATRKELALVREEGFQFMASLDVIRNELKHVTTETNRLKKKEGKVDSTIQNLNFKILRAKSKLEVVYAAKEKARSIVVSLSHTLEKLKTETEEAKKENEDVSQEVAATKEEIQKVELDIDMTEERLQGVMQKLEVAKASEALTLEKLKTLTESTMRERALTAQHSSMITISKFEYEYLTNHAASAEEIPDKKVAAAEAWIEALKASEKEILMETKIAQRELKESKLEQELEVYTKEKMLSRRVSSSEELDNWPRKREKSSSKNFQRAMSRKSIKLNGTITPARGAKFQKIASPAARHISPFTIKKRKKVIPNLTKLFRARKTIGIDSEFKIQKVIIVAFYHC